MVASDFFFLSVVLGQFQKEETWHHQLKEVIKSQFQNLLKVTKSKEQFLQLALCT
jgi:hypothetical protein